MTQHTVWKRGRKHSFPKTFVAGHESDGRQLFVAQFIRTDVSVSMDVIIRDGSVTYDPSFTSIDSAHLGKAGVHLHVGGAYSFGGDEKNEEDFFVFAPNDPENYHWVSAQNGHIPPGAVPGWNRNENHYVGRIAWAGGWHPGKIIPSSKACFIGYGGGEKASRSYQVLCRKGA